jgi:hypothetical protein
MLILRILGRTMILVIITVLTAKLLLQGQGAVKLSQFLVSTSNMKVIKVQAQYKNIDATNNVYTVHLC